MTESFPFLLITVFLEAALLRQGCHATRAGRHDLDWTARRNQVPIKPLGTTWCCASFTTGALSICLFSRGGIGVPGQRVVEKLRKPRTQPEQLGGLPKGPMMARELLKHAARSSNGFVKWSDFAVSDCRDPACLVVTSALR